MPPDSIRSRSGCISCRRRKKKCDEVFNAQGVCGRCHHGSFECIREGKVIRPPTSSTASSKKKHLPPKVIPPPQSLLLLQQSQIKSDDPYPPLSTPLPLPPPPLPLSFTSPLPPQPFTTLPFPPSSRSQPFPSTSSQAFPSTSTSTPISSLFSTLDSIPLNPDSAEEIARDAWEAFEGMALINSISWLGEEGKGKAREDVVEEVKHCEKVEHAGAEGGCDCSGSSRLYASLNDDFYQSIPQPVRRLVTLVTGNMAASYALTQAASMAILLLYKARNQEEEKELLLRQSEIYFEHAKACLSTADIPLEAQLIGVADMQLHQFDLTGASGAYAILQVGSYFVTSALGPRPPLDISTLGNPTHIGTWMFVFSDVFRTVCLPHTRTLFNLVGLPGSSFLHSSPSHNITDAIPAISRDYATHLGLPMGLLLCFAAVSNLAVEIWEGGVGEEEGRRKGEVIEEAVKGWYPYRNECGMRSEELIDTVATQEMWRQAALIYLYQSIYKVGSLSSVLRRSLSTLLSLGSRKITPPSKSTSLYAGSFRACPWWFAATLATEPEDREVCRRGLEACGPQKAYRDNLKAAERVWKEVDERGWGVDWKEVCEKEGMFVGFL